jgi:hypothetical protein
MKANLSRTTSSPVPRAEADLLGGGVVVSRILLVDGGVE